jgi:hypothetical protein
MEPFVDFGLFEVLALIAGVGVIRRRKQQILRWAPAPIAGLLRRIIRDPDRSDHLKGAVDGKPTP